MEYGEGCGSPRVHFLTITFFIPDTESKYSREVKQLLYPLFVYLHLDMVHSGLKSAADSFYSRFHGMFLQNIDQKDIMEQLRSTLNSQDIYSNSKLRTLIENKYVVSFTEESYNYLLRYLQSDNNSTLCKVLASHIHLDVQCSQQTGYQLYSVGAQSRSDVVGLEPSEIPTTILQNEAALEMLQDSIKQVKDGPPSLTTICFYAFYNTDQLLNTAEISPDNKLLSAGFDNSCIKLWSLRSKKLKFGPQQVDVSRINLACDIVDNEV